jgi:transcriptional regulator with XRE-family HTH domain
VAEGDLQRIVGLNLARVRHARGLSQEELADELEFHRTYLGAVERGERNLTLKSVERLADKLGVGPLELLKPVRASRRKSR